MPVRPALAVLALVALAGCGSSPTTAAPPATEPAPTESAASAPPATDGTRTVEFKARDYGFPGLPGFTAMVGEKVRFAMANISSDRQHDFRLFLPDGKELGTIDLLEPGEKGEVVLTLPVAGSYRFVCGVGNHEEKGQKGTFLVS